MYHIPLIDQVPVIGPILSGHTLFVPIAWLLLIFTALVVGRSRFGLELRATGIMPEAVRIRGGNPDSYRAIAIIFSGVTCGLAGASLSLELGAFVPNMSAGRGWIALVMVFLGRRRPWGVAAAGIFFAGTEYASIAMQGSIGLPRTLALAVPYVLTLLSMILFAIVRRRAAQSATKPR
jgi:simple sugar transport system permease protein